VFDAAGAWSLRRFVRQPVVLMFFFASSFCVHAQLELVTFAHPFHSHKLAGFVSDPSGATVSGVVIEDCDSTFKQVLASATTDANGYFAFPGIKTGTTHFLRLSHYGFDPMQITVKLSRFAMSGLTVRLHIAN
jgi:hypothetical protein